MNGNTKIIAHRAVLVAALLAGATHQVSSQTFTKITTGNLVTDSSQSISAAWADLDGDGNLDVYVANTQGNDRLYRNNGNGTFTSLVTSPVATAGGATTSGAWGDYNNDGNLDLFAANRFQSHFLFQGTGGTNFINVGSSPVLTGGPETYHSSWVDYDNDGYLDLYVVNTFNVNFLYRNNGNGTFSNNASAVIANLSGAWIGSAWADYNGDGRADVFLADGGTGANALYSNDGNGSFTQALSGQVASDLGTSQAGAWADYDNDGDLDLFVANRDGVNFLYRNEGGTSFTKVTSGDIVTDVADSNSGAWGDYDNDGWLDLYVANGDTPANQTNFLYHNNGNGTFAKITTGTPATDVEQSLCAIWVDYDNDGSLDLHVTSATGSSLYRSSGAAGHWLKTRLVGSLSNRSAIGAKVRIRAQIAGATRTLLRFVSGDGGFHGQNLEQHFGLGSATVIDELKVEWPSGAVTILNGIPADQRITISEDGAHFFRVVPNAAAGIEAPGYSASLAQALRSQQVYPAGQFPPMPIRINSLRFRRDSSRAPFASASATVRFKLSTTSRTENTLGSSFALNVGSNETTVFDGVLTVSSPTTGAAPYPFEMIVPLTTPFVYDPAQGNLLVEHQVFGSSSIPFTDGEGTSGDGVARAFSLDANAATASNVDTGADTIQFEYSPINELQFSPAPGVFTNSVQVAILSGVPNSVIRYTTDGNDPTVSSTTYTVPFTLTQTTTVKARLFVNGFPASEIAEATYTRYVPPDIAFNPPGQLFTNQLSVTLVNNVGSGTIRYTLNGSAPTSASTAYVPGIPINLTAAATIRAQVFLGNFFVSDVFTEDYARVYAFGNDGVPFAWREQYFGPDFLTNPCAAADADCDDDGYVVAEEYQYATDPTDGNSAPEILLSVRAVPRLTFNTIAGRSYRIRRTTTLNPPAWQTIVESMLATGPELHYVDEEAPDNSFYQVELIRD